MATFQLLKSLSFEGAQVAYFTLNTKKHWASQIEIDQNFPFVKVISVPHLVSISGTDALKNLFTSDSYFLSRYHNQKAKEELVSLLKNNDFDTVIIEGLYSSVFLQTIREYHKKSIVYRAHNLEHQIWSRLLQSESNLLKKWYLKIQVKRLKNEEEQFVENVDKCVSISPEDQKAFLRIDTNRGIDSEQAQERSFLYLPGMDPGLVEKSKLQPGTIFHLASMEWDANVSGLEWFLTKVWPLVLSQQPQMTIHIGGKSLDKSDKRYFHSRLINHGEVDDAAEFMKHHGIGIVPLRAGSGLRMKLLQAMSLGVPCVSTSIGAQGLNVENGKELLIADTPAEFAEALLKLNTDRKFAIEMGKNALNYVVAHHNSVANTRQLINFLQKN
jgi:glycosyltransferase involved in cell wall biosynthesis